MFTNKRPFVEIWGTLRILRSYIYGSSGNPINEGLELGHTTERLEEQGVKRETMKQRESSDSLRHRPRGQCGIFGIKSHSCPIYDRKNQSHHQLGTFGEVADRKGKVTDNKISFGNSQENYNTYPESGV